LIAYLAGLVASDGHLKKDSYGIQVSTANLEFAKNIQKIIAPITGKLPRIYQNGCYVVEINDKALYKDLKERFRIPSGEKSDKLVSPLITEQEEIRQFIKGFCDGDSSVHKRKMRKKYVPRIRIMSTSKAILEWIRKQFIKDGIGCSKPFKDIPHGFGDKMNWRIEIYGNNVRKFKEKIGYSHPEKLAKLESLLTLLKK